MGNYTPLASLDEPSPAGFSGNDMLRLVERPFSAPLLWHSTVEDWGYSLTIAPKADGGESLEVEIGHAGGAARYLDVGSACPIRVELDVIVRLRTESGAFDEEVEAILFATSTHQVGLGLIFRTDETSDPPPYARAPFAQGEADYQPRLHALGGSLAVSARDEENSTTYRATGLLVSLVANELGLTGNVVAWLASPDGGRGSTVAAVGSHCGEQLGFAWDSAQPTSQNGLSPEQIVDLLNALSIEAVHEAGVARPLEHHFSALTDEACADLSSGSPSLELEVDWALSTAHEELNIDGSWPVIIRAPDDGSSAPNIAIGLREGDHLAPNTLESRWGIMGLDLSGYDTAGLSLELEVTRSGTQAEVNGLLELTALTVPEDRPVATGDGDLQLRLTLRSPPAP